MGWDADDAENYRKLSESVAAMAETIESGESNSPLVELLVKISSSYAKLADYSLAREQTAHLRCDPGVIGESEEARRANLETRAIQMRLQEHWAAVVAELDKAEAPNPGNERRRSLITNLHRLARHARTS